jgi:hypothetical protein
MIKNFKAAYCGAVGILGLIGFTISAIHLVEHPLYIIPAVACAAVFLKLGDFLDKKMAR